MIILPPIDPVAFSIPIMGGIPIRWYALAYIAGFLLGQRYMVKLNTRFPAPHVDAERIEKLFVWVIFGVILGGRLGFVLFYNLPHYLNTPLDILKTWQGGMSFHGGLLGVILAIILFCWRHKIHPADVGDRMAPAVCFGLFFGRLANFLNGELWGKPTDVPWAMVFPTDPSQLARHPSQLYEAGLEGLLLFVILALVAKGGWPRWRLSGIFLIGYGLARFIVEYFREPDVYAYLGSFGFSTGQLLSFPMILLGLFFIIFSAQQAKK